MDATSTVMQLNQQSQANLDAWGQLYDNAKVADMMVKANPDLVTRMGFQSPEQFKSLSAQDKIAATTGYIKQQGIQEHVARMRDYQVQTQAREQAMEDDKAIGGFLQNFAKAPDGDMKSKLDWALINSPNVAGRNLPRALDSLARWQQLAAPEKTYGDVQFTDVPGRPGAKVVTRDGYTSVIQPPGDQDIASKPDPYAELDYKALVAEETDLQKQLSAARGKKQIDLATQLAGELNNVRKRKAALRGGGTRPTANSAAPYPEGTRLKGPGGKTYVVKDGKPVPE